MKKSVDAATAEIVVLPTELVATTESRVEPALDISSPDHPARIWAREQLAAVGPFKASPAYLAALADVVQRRRRPAA